ncbi:hypothetical protein PF010_g7560 [Phytophthora fragariae]|uniref:Uncharacterized protein n=1 Tax=Phytophthora fragariae TaxID=53985 RepID=A0A6A3T4D9_9STRA|nr:hypothetical protein PF003_g6333 [Phytophthora fragariae]KAE8942983.1 hypothetical protein PF009_g7276 [Phytophthora fragariae]KAE9120234.1 hypothetical protein PF010_g7560 [Phytophthora fragariae]KAE9126479.1 hypothetical protein PF007_g5966 [Phytophthora fragariae]KAE9151252.1 hypothetical protein PF006_g4438 [Phytophthora fragariae]
MAPSCGRAFATPIRTVPRVIVLGRFRFFSVRRSEKPARLGKMVPTEYTMRVSSSKANRMEV